MQRPESYCRILSEGLHHLATGITAYTYDALHHASSLSGLLHKSYIKKNFTDTVFNWYTVL